jgi:hypothetical protein
MEIIDDLLTALENLQQAKAEYDKAAKNCHEDRDYFLSDEIEDIEKAKKKLSDIFYEAVKSVVLDVVGDGNRRII